MSRLTNREEIFPSIYIEPTKDLTERFKPNEAGVICGVGYMSIGNPLYALNIVGTTERLKSTVTAKGGNPKNETLYHLKEFFAEYPGRVYLARLLGADSTTKVLSVVYNVDTYEFDSTVEQNIFGVSNLDTWGDTTPTNPVELLIKLCPQSKITVDITAVAGKATITMADEFGNRIYKVEGHLDPAHLDDNNESDFIGNIADDRVIGIKVDTTHADYSGDFTITETFTNGLAADSGEISVTQAENILRSVSKKSDYMVSFGQTDEELLKMMKSVADEATIGYIVDIVASSIALAKNKKTTLGLDDHMTCCIWNRVPYKFGTGVQNIGLSGFVAGRSVARNIGGKLKRAERRISGIAGINHAIPRVVPRDIPALTNDEKTELTTARINTVEDFLGKVCITDILSALEKETDLMSFPVADGLGYIKRTLGQYLDSQMFKNLQVAKAFMENEARVFFEHCQANAFFDNDAETPWTFEVYDENNDTVVIDFQCYMEGVMRKGVVRSTILKG
ncbi:MAG: hypothetical protein ABXS91_08520 [Sulfurimonas sp.]